MKFSRFVVATLALSLLSVAAFSQTNEAARKALLSWKEKNGGPGISRLYQAAGFSVDNSNGGVTASFYLEYGPDVVGQRATQFIVQPVMTTVDSNGKSVTVDVGKPGTISVAEGMMLEKGLSLEDRTATPKLTIVMPPTANAVRLGVRNMFGETGMGQIVLGEGASGALGSLE
jgi:hypothetical protein